MNNEDIRAIEDLVERVMRKVLKDFLKNPVIRPSSYKRSLDCRGIVEGKEGKTDEHE